MTAPHNPEAAISRGDRRGRPEILIAPFDVRLVCTGCGRRSRREVGDLYARGALERVGDSPPALTLDECLGCGLLPHFIDLEIDQQWWNRYQRRDNYDPDPED